MKSMVKEHSAWHISKSVIGYAFIVLALLSDVLIRMIQIKGIDYLCFIFLVWEFIAFSGDVVYKKAKSVLPIKIWLIWVIYAFINWMVVGIHMEENTFNFIIRIFILPIGMMWVVYYEGSVDLEKTSKVVLCAFFLQVVIGVLFQDSGSGEGTKWDARGGAELGNGLALTSCCMCFYALFCKINRFIGKKVFLVVIILSVVGIMFVATRKAFAGIIILFVFYLIGDYERRKRKKIVSLFFFVAVIALVGSYMMNHTVLGARFAETENQGEQVMMRYDAPVFLKFLGERAIQYMLSWNLFLQNPITGIGIRNFIVLTDYPVVLHSEYMVQLCENGIIGFLLFCMFFISMFKLLFKKYNKETKKVVLICMGGLLCILFIDLTAWTYQFPRYFAVYGIIMAYGKPYIYRKRDISIKG